MKRARVFAALFAAGTLFIPFARSLADPLPGTASDPSSICRAAVAIAEAQHAIPDHLLAAIARVETGRPDPATGTVQPWPWTIDTGGAGQFFATRAQAIAAVRTLTAHGVRSVDVGCLQINLQQHPDAFVSLEEAFQPYANASYAAGFLRRLFDMTHDWMRAAALYHSATPVFAEPYRARVMAAWPIERRQSATATATAIATAMSLPVRPVIGRDGLIMPSRQLVQHPVSAVRR